jgi:hypothetical protein
MNKECSLQHWDAAKEGAHRAFYGSFPLLENYTRRKLENEYGWHLLFSRAAVTTLSSSKWQRRKFRREKNRGERMGGRHCPLFLSDEVLAKGQGRDAWGRNARQM